MPKEKASQPVIGVGEVGHYVCAILIPPLKDKEKADLNTEVEAGRLPEPMFDHAKIGGKACELLVWPKQSFGFRDKHRVEAFQADIKSFAKQLPKRTHLKKLQELAPSAGHRFKKLDKTHEAKKKPLSLEEMAAKKLIKE